MSTTSEATRQPTVLSRVADIRPEEARTAVLMFAYAFSVMTAYNVVQPITRSAFIDDLGADNLPYILLATGMLVGLVMQLYGWVLARLPQRWALPILQLGMAGILMVFVFLFQSRVPWVSSGFYLFGQILGILLLSQFWTLANDVYDPRQARRLFGFIGGGASLGGMAGSGVAALFAEAIGTSGLLLASVVALVATVCLVVAIISRETRAPIGNSDTKPAGGLGEALALVRGDANLRQIAWLVSLAAIGSVLIDQQLNMAAEQFRGSSTDSVTSFLASVRFLLSSVSLLLQVFLVKQIYRLLGLGFALVTLPVALGTTGALILASGALWAPTVASVANRSIRYTIDRTTREIFFLPVAPAVRRQVKSFIDVTVDRIARGVGAVLALVMIKVLGLSWPLLSVLTLLVAVVWLGVALGARNRYVEAVRAGLETRALEPADVRVDVADLTTVEALLEELAHPEEQRVLYAIDLLESFDKRNLVTPLLLHHESALVRARAIDVMSRSNVGLPERWQPMLQQMVEDSDPDVRAKAIVALAKVSRRDATNLARELLAEDQTTPHVAISAAVVLMSSGGTDDIRTAEAALRRLTSDPDQTSTHIRRDVAQAIRQIASPRVRHLLVPLLQDSDPAVAEEAMRSVVSVQPLEELFIPTLVSLLSNSRLKSGARDALVRYGEPVLDMLSHVASDAGEDPRVRRHIPATIARIPSQRSMDLLVSLLDDPDHVLRDKAIAGMEALRKLPQGLTCAPDRIDAMLMSETRSYFEHLTLHDDVFGRGAMPTTALLARVLTERTEQSVGRVYRLLALLHPWKNIATTRWAIDHGNASTRAQAFEYLDNILPSHMRHAVLPMLEDLPTEDKVRRGHSVRHTHPVGLEDALLALINDRDQVVASAAIDLVGSARTSNLTGDVEHVLAHRDARDWVVFEAASWALAEMRLTPEERNKRWMEPLPAIVLADRVRHLSMFESITTDELCRLASRGRQIRKDDQALLLLEGVVPEAFHVLLDGSVTTQTRGEKPERVEGPILIGFEPALEARQATETVRAVGPIVTVAVTRDELLGQLTGSTDFVRGLFRTILESASATLTPAIVPGKAHPELAHPDIDSLTPIQRMLALQQIPIFASLPSEEIAELAKIARTVPFRTGDTLSDEADPPVCCIVMSGSLSLQDLRAGGERGRAQAGDAVGLFETLAGTTRGHLDRAPLRLTVEESGTALRLERDELFDLIGQRPGLLQHLFSALFERSRPMKPGSQHHRTASPS